MIAAAIDDKARELAAASAAAAADAGQDELFEARPAVPEETRFGAARLTIAEARVDAERRVKGGRPKNSQNKVTKQLREWVLRGGMLPQKWMMDWLTLAPEELAARLRCTVAEAWDRQADLAGRLAPYFMSAMAATDDRGNAVASFGFFFGDGRRDAPGAPGAEKPPWERERERIEALRAVPSQIVDQEKAA